jgi:hypothetical protein
MLSRIRIARPFLSLGVALLGLLMLAAPRPTAAQGCALCYTQAASSGNRMIEALRSGILIMIVPPTLISVGMIFVLYRKCYQVRPAGDATQSDSW